LSATVDLIIQPRWIVPVEPATTVLEHHCVVVDQGRILDVLPQGEASVRYQARRTEHLGDHVLIPGLVNLHTHAAMNLMRGIADDLPLMRWLQEAIWPIEGKHVSPAFVADGTLLAAAEMLRGGITTCNDMYFYPDSAASAFHRVGMRAVIGIVMLDFPSPYASDADDYLRKGLAARDQWRGSPRIGFSIAPHAPYTVSDAGLERAASLAAELDLPIHIHVHEVESEIDTSIARYGARPLTRLARLGLLGPGLIGVHAVHLDETDLALLSHHGCNIAHCPTSNMKLGSGIAPLSALLERGINVGLGTDGAASNNRLDLFQEMRHAALLAKAATRDAATVPAHAALHMATLGGARALGLDTQIGSITVGKQADLCAIRLIDPLMQPCFDPISHLAYVAGREQVSHVWIDGELRVQNGALLLQIAHKELLGISTLWQTRFAN